MKRMQSHFASMMGLSAVAGLIGTVVMMAMRSFDERYAPRTIPRTKKDPGAFVVHAAERAIGMAGAVPASIEKSAALTIRAGYGTLFGVLYGLWRGRRKDRSALNDGMILGAVVYAAGHLGWMPTLGLSKPVWKQDFPQIAGELLRHVAYGIATTAVYEMIEAMQ